MRLYNDDGFQKVRFFKTIKASSRTVVDENNSVCNDLHIYTVDPR